MRNILYSTCLAIVLCIASPSKSFAQSEPFLGQISWFPYTFCPRGWTEANGALLSIAQNTALFALIGTTYGGNGQTTFALPDLRGRSALGLGLGPGLSPRTLGELAGTERETLTTQQIPAHNHALRGQSAAAQSTDPQNRVLAQTGAYREGPAGATLGGDSISPSGGNQPHNNMPPYLVLRPCIATAGIFPSRP